MTEVTPSQRLWAGLLSGSVGLWLAYIVWSRQPGLLAPPAVVYLAATAFASAGLTLLLQARGYTRASTVPALLVVVALAGVGAWVGFGLGAHRPDRGAHGPRDAEARAGAVTCG